MRQQLTTKGLRVALTFALGSASASAQTTAIKAGRLIDPASAEVTTGATILVQAGRVTAVGRNVTVPSGADVIDLSRYTVLPGLIDAHVHLAIGGPPRATALADLNAGFTTVVDLGSRTTRLLTIRDSINAGFIPGPRVLAAGVWIGKQGGVCEFSGIGIPGSAEGFRARVRENVQAGADVIKACVSGWPADAFADPAGYEMPDSVLVAIVDEARKSGRKVIAHDISLGGVQAALRSGVSGLAHAAYVDSATAAQLAARRVFMIPTLTTLAPDTSAGARALVASTRLAYRAGVPIVFGTDGGVLPHGENAREFLALAGAGISALDALRAATSNAARAFGIADSVGLVAPGMVADIIAVDGDPLADLTALQRVPFVMSRGRVVRGP